jgi:hypothetical protein
MKKSRRAKLLHIVELHNEARRLAGNVSANQLRFLEVAAARGKELEPSGWLVEETKYCFLKKPSEWRFFCASQLPRSVSATSRESLPA